MIPTKLIRPNAQLPTRGSEHAAGLDLYAALDPEEHGESITFTGGCTVLIPTGVTMAIPEGYYGQIASRSGLFVKRELLAFPGVIDADYRGEIMVAMYQKHTALDAKVEIFNGERIAQLLILPVGMQMPELVDDLPETVRGDGGFGSTGT